MGPRSFQAVCTGISALFIGNSEIADWAVVSETPALGVLWGLLFLHPSPEKEVCPCYGSSPGRTTRSHLADPGLSWDSLCPWCRSWLDSVAVLCPALIINCRFVRTAILVLVSLVQWSKPVTQLKWSAT